jgi:hypothetical protein
VTIDSWDVGRRAHVAVRQYVVVAAVLIAAWVDAGPANAGEWVQVSCQNPNHSTAPSDGWTVGTLGQPAYGSSESARCSATSPMFALLSTQAADAVGTAEYLEYAPPAGSTLSGGTVGVDLSADGGGYGASGTAVLYEPALAYPGDVFFQCASGLAPCYAGTNDYDGPIALPANAGGDLFLSAGCGGEAGASCDSGGTNGAWSEVQVSSAEFLLANDSSPGGSGFSGSALQRNARGTAHLVFTATDPGGPGVYLVIVDVDGRQVWQGTPSTDSGRCVAVGTDSSSGALMFDWQQPCPQTEIVDAPVPTARLADGRHELTVTILDAAGNRSTVFDQSITTSNPGSTPLPKGRRTPRARFVASWHWNRARTRLLAIHVRGLAARARVNLKCSGRGCPRLRLHSAAAAGVASLLRELHGRWFAAGDRLLITVTERGLAPERIEIVIRNGAGPRARLL